MSSIRLDFVSQDHMVFSGDVYEIVAPGIDGVLGILPKHAPLLTILTAGEVMVKRQGEDDLFFAVSGGWMEVRPDKVTILARTAERSDEIDLKRAEAARASAEALLAQGVEREDRAGAGDGAQAVTDPREGCEQAQRLAAGEPRREPNLRRGRQVGLPSQGQNKRAARVWDALHVSFCAAVAFRL